MDLHELFFRPHNYGHVFVDALHPSYIGQKVIAEKIFEHLQTKKFYKESSEEVTNKLEVVPGKVWGVP